MGVNLPEAGLYTVTVRFYDESDEEMASATYELTVDPPYSERGFFASLKNYLWLLAFLAGLVAGVLIGLLWKRGSVYGS
jgi:hypothetical protein